MKANEHAEWAIGTIIKREHIYGDTVTHTKYFKVTGRWEMRWTFVSTPEPAYTIVSCSKHGKEFTSCVTLFVRSINYTLNPGEVDPHTTVVRYTAIGHAEVGIKANIQEGNEIGAAKRRIDYLQSEIASHTKEIEKLQLFIKGK